jgi:hypothetical protein
MKHRVMVFALMRFSRAAVERDAEDPIRLLPVRQ